MHAQEYILLALSQPPALEFSEDDESQGAKGGAFIQAIPKMVRPCLACSLLRCSSSHRLSAVLSDTARHAYCRACLTFCWQHPVADGLTVRSSSRAMWQTRCAPR